MTTTRLTPVPTALTASNAPLWTGDDFTSNDYIVTLNGSRRSPRWPTRPTRRVAVSPAGT